MTELYNCRHSGDEYRISKFDSHFDLESSYLCTETECTCPAGHRPTCRHRQMLPKFIARGAINTEWFFDHSRGGWVQGEIEPAPEVVIEESAPTKNITATEIAEREAEYTGLNNPVVEHMVNTAYEVCKPLLKPTPTIRRRV